MFEATKPSIISASEHRATSVRTQMWWEGSVRLAARGVYLESQGSIQTCLSSLFICQELFKVNGCSNWKGSLQIENIPPQA